MIVLLAMFELFIACAVLGCVVLGCVVLDCVVLDWTAA